MELEEAIKILKTQLDTKNEKGYYKPMCEEATRVVLNHLTKQEKMIKLMALAISSYDGQLVINQYKDRNEVKAKFEEYVEDGTYEQYFEKKAEEQV